MYTNHINPVAQKNQDAFCTALFQLLLKKPLEKISVTELCHMADLDRTTFYRSFESKDDVLDYYLDRQMTLLAGQLPAYSTLEKNLTALFRWTYAERKNLCVLMDCHLTSFFSDALSEKIILVLISNIEVGDARQFVPWPVSLPGENRYFRNSFIGAYMGFFKQLALWKLCRTTRGSGQMYGFVLSSLRRVKRNGGLAENRKRRRRTDMPSISSV